MAENIILGVYGVVFIYLYVLWSHGEGHHRRSWIGGVKICDEKTTNSHAKVHVRHGGVHIRVTNKRAILERIHAHQVAHVHRVYGLTALPGMYHHLPMGLTYEEAYRITRYLYSANYGMSITERATYSAKRNRT